MLWERHPFCRTFHSPLNNVCLAGGGECVVLANNVLMSEAVTLQFLKGDGRCKGEVDCYGCVAYGGVARQSI
jgi:hypothetical protein